MIWCFLCVFPGILWVQQREKVLGDVEVFLDQEPKKTKDSLTLQSFTRYATTLNPKAGLGLQR